MLRNLKLILIFVFILAVILISYKWYQEQQIQKSGSAQEESKQSETNNQDYQSQPRLIIISPENGEKMRSGSATTRYLVTGYLGELLNLDIVLNQSGGGTWHYVVPTGNQGQGSYPLTNLAAGEYNLMMRLVKKDGNFFEQPWARAVVYFSVEN